jgi:predicted nuclease of predicted toxin-antitoxin system
MTSKFLIDECLHTSLVDDACASGHSAAHVIYRGLAGAKDWQLMEKIREEEFTLVTNNRSDFLRLYQHEKLHSGVIIMVPNVPPGRQ